MPLLPSFFFLSFYVTIPFNHRYFIAYLSMLKRCQSEVLSNTYRSSIEDKAKFYRRQSEVLSKSKRSSIEYLSKIYRRQSEDLSNTYRTSIEHHQTTSAFSWLSMSFTSISSGKCFSEWLQIKPKTYGRENEHCLKSYCVVGDLRDYYLKIRKCFGRKWLNASII